jgi:hypothetical protein
MFMICTKLHTYINFISLQVSIIPRSYELPKRTKQTRKKNNKPKTKKVLKNKIKQKRKTKKTQKNKKPN